MMGSLVVELRARVGAMSLEVSFALGREPVAVVGRNGSGKTSLLHLLLGVLTPERGRIEVDAADSEIGRLQQEWNAALERVERGYRAQGMFLSNVSHELKTPIAVLLSQAQVLRQGELPDEFALFAGNVEEEMRRRWDYSGELGDISGPQLLATCHA